MELDIYDFLINCYSSESFFDDIGNNRNYMCKEEFYIKEYKNKKIYNINDWDLDIEYSLYKDGILADILKEIMIQYLGYHSVERVFKTITTSELHIYETFYNYLLNDFTIFQMPKMIFDHKKGEYIKYNSNEFFLPDSELRLRDEIQSIKRLVPIEKRIKYYR